MSAPIEDYALIGDTHTAALVGRNASIDWFCLPRFDSPAVFASLLGAPSNGHWQLAPRTGAVASARRYREGTLVLESDFESGGSAVRVIDFMPPRNQRPDMIRIVEGLRGPTRMRMHLVPRFDYGHILPWVEGTPMRLNIVAGPHALVLSSPVPVRVENGNISADFVIAEGQRLAFGLTWHRSYEEAPGDIDPEAALADTESWWRAWTGRCAYQGPWQDAVRGSLVVLKALTYAPTGGIVAAATTSLPEKLHGVRNWDYRYCWLRDATFTLYALLTNGYKDEAAAWRDWLLRAVAGDPAQMQIMYGIDGSRLMPELTVSWLPGYANSAPVRIGNGAALQFQLDVFGEVMDCLHQARRQGVETQKAAWRMQRSLLEFLESKWQEPDEGLWEVRGPRRHFTHSKVMAWVAFDRAVQAVEHFRLEGPVERWRKLRDGLHEEICARGFDRERGAFTQAYGSPALDASLLMVPLVGFLPATDSRVVGTVRAIESELMRDGLLMRYVTYDKRTDGLPPGEGAFLACTFWLADNYVLLGRHAEAKRLFEHLLSLRNDVGLLAEQYDPRRHRFLGNFPQAFSHVGLVNTAWNLNHRAESPAVHRPRLEHEPRGAS